MSLSLRYRREISKLIPDDAQRFCEVGAAHGRVSARVLREHPQIEAYLIDTWYWDEYAGSGRNYKTFDKTTWRDIMICAMESVAPYYDRAHIIQLESSMAAGAFPDRWFDVVFVDANNQTSDVLRDIETWFPKTTIICGRFYGNIRVANAVKEFAVPRMLVPKVSAGGVWELRHGLIFNRSSKAQG